MAILVGMGAATSCGGSDGGVVQRRPDGTRFVHEWRDAGVDEVAGDAAADDGSPDSDADEPTHATEDGNAEDPLADGGDGGDAVDPAAGGGDTPDAEEAADPGDPDDDAGEDAAGP
ncbi:MAG: hypothetical protein JW751_18220 [Polyangiaceae bacterium]|nr:hypothetical protein [Polyangiaceae bacterium]